MSCSICDEKPKEFVTCAKCTGSSCRPCFQTYLLNSPLSSSCMHCRTPMTDDFVLDNTRLTWRTKEYKPYRETLLLDMEKARLPDTQQYATAVVNARGLKRQLQLELNRIVTAMREDKTTKAERDAMLQQRNQLRVNISDANQAEFRNLHRPGQGPHQVQVRRPMIKACPAETCRGFLNDDFSCPLCETKVCKSCHEILLTEQTHQCNPETVESVKAVAAQTRPCPSCASVISKIDGCDQMWCTQCQTTFSWRTGLKEEGHTHNPHYYEFMRRNGGTVPRTPGDIPQNPQAQCGMPTLQSLIQRFHRRTSPRYTALITGWRNYHDQQAYHRQQVPWPPPWRIAHHDNTVIPPWDRPVDAKLPFKDDYELKYLVALTTFHRYTIHLQAVSRTLHVTPPENHTLRVQFMLGEISEDTFKTTIQRRDKAYRKDIAKRQIYDMAYQTVSDIFQEFVTSDPTTQSLLPEMNTVEVLHKSYSHILEIFTYANLCFSKLEKAYTCTIDTYTTNPFLTNRWM